MGAVVEQKRQAQRNEILINNTGYAGNREELVMLLLYAIDGAQDSSIEMRASPHSLCR